MKIAVAMSGGVDSSAAAGLLQEAGHELVGFTMQLWDQRRGLSGVDEHGEPLPSRCCHTARPTSLSPSSSPPAKWISASASLPGAE